MIKIISQILKGKSVTRSLQNLEFEKITLKGNIIDLGAKNSSSTYYNFLNIENDHKITFVDYYVDGPNIVKIDLEDKFKLISNSYDNIILNNTLEHLYDYKNCLNESFRILKVDGELLGSVPFLHKIHDDPFDFHRYSHDCLKKVFEEAGFRKVKVKPLGTGPFLVIFSLISPYLKFSVFKVLFFSIFILIDKLISVFKKNLNEIYPLAYFFRVVK